MRWLDLSRPMTPGMPVYPGDPAVDFVPAATRDRDGFAVTALHLGTHAGTHLDAGSHYLDGGQTVETVPLARCCGAAQVWRLACEPGQVLTPADLQPGLAGLQPGARVILHTGWQERWGTAEYYRHYPSLSAAAAAALVAAGIWLLGLDTPSPDGDSDSAHRLLLAAGVVIVENLCGLTQLPDHVTLIAAPLPLVGLDGSPVRALAGVSDDLDMANTCG